MTYRLRQGDCTVEMKAMASDSIDAIVTDPPYEIGFKSEKWDNSGIAFSVEMWREALRVIKPGGYLLSFGGPRTHHRVMCAIEDSGFILRDCFMWLYGNGLPKSLDVSKALDRAAGAKRDTVVGRYSVPSRTAWNPRQADDAEVAAAPGFFGGVRRRTLAITAPATALAQRWSDWGTSVKPAYEPVILAQKPLSGTYAENVTTWGVGCLNIGEARGNNGRWPTNVLLDEESAELLDQQGAMSRNPLDPGGISRFFYAGRANKKDRGPENTHPTVKPVALMRYLVRLVTPPGGTVLDQFAGSGTTGVACVHEGFNFVGIELSAEYVDMSERRISEVYRQRERRE